MDGGYALGQWERAVGAALTATDPAVRQRAEAKAVRWRSVLSGIADGTLSIGSRTPVADTPVWVTLRVLHGGFASGGYLAQGPLRADELATLSTTSSDASDGTGRDRLNRWYLGDAGRAVLLDALRTGAYEIDVPEEAALLVLSWLVGNGHAEAALDLLAELHPFLPVLRFTPRLADVPEVAPDTVHVATVDEVRGALLAAEVPAQLAAMRTTVGVWQPLQDRLVELWCATVEGDLPRVVDGRVSGGWPAVVWPQDWADRRARLLADHAIAVAEFGERTSRRSRKSTIAVLHTALELCEVDSRALSGRDVGQLRRTLANTIGRNGAPGSAEHAARRTDQATLLSRPTHASLARAVAGRLAGLPGTVGIAEPETVLAPVEGTPLPPGIAAKAGRAAQAPIETLVEHGAIASGDVLAAVLPQLSADAVAAHVADQDLARLFARTYRAFRSRRSLLLTQLGHQVRLTELPWISAINALPGRREGDGALALLGRVSMLALTAFPQAILPNPLVAEFRALAQAAGVRIALVEELAADIFAEAFAEKWALAAEVASRTLRGTLYARYYDLPDTWLPRPDPPHQAHGKDVAGDFYAACASRAEEAQSSGSSYVARNGTVIEQGQILTTHNLAQLVDALDLTGAVRSVAADLADRALHSMLTRLARPVRDDRQRRDLVRGAALNWRQALYYLSHVDHDTAVRRLAAFRAQVERSSWRARLAPVLDGLDHVMAGGHFTATGRVEGGSGRRFLGWSYGPHWLLSEPGD